MRTDLFDFELPEERIALHPVSPRDGRDAVAGGRAAFEDRGVRDLPTLLREGDALVFNDTRVIRRRSKACAGAATPRAVALQPDRAPRCQPLARAGAAGQAPAGGRPPALRPRRQRVPAGALDATVAARGDAGEVEIAFDLPAPISTWRSPRCGDAAAAVHRRQAPRSQSDRDDYQTIYAAHDGAVAAPTAGLHFTPELMAALDARGISRHFVTLHVGAGTFLPVKADDTRRPQDAFREGRDFRRDRGGAQRRARQRAGASSPSAPRRCACWRPPRARARSRPSAGATDIFITPGYRFRAVDMLMTNFHLPRSTLFMLVAAFAGSSDAGGLCACYRAGYRFYSYGDASLLFPAARRP